MGIGTCRLTFVVGNLMYVQVLHKYGTHPSVERAGGMGAEYTKIKIKTVMNKFIVENSDRSHRKPDKALLYNGTY